MDPRELYQELILDHGRRPRNFRVPEGPTCRAEGKNPLCGDHVAVSAVVVGDRVEDVGFQGSGCAICMAAASTMTEAVRGHTREEIAAMFARFHGVVTGAASGDAEDLGKLAAFSGLSEFPMRVKCATLAWHTLEAALQGRGEPVSSE
ncbi:MAG: SUF system NifU family Fe-S cluster assembly protein [Deltaproteobacteria bacterium]|nr:SUF system NifU family Fe-S cluster assembly protein [Deltaproteobacteria bacterium]